MVSIELDQQTAEQLSEQAAARGMTVSEYLRSLMPASPNGGEQRLSLEALVSLLADHAFDGPTLRADFSRADI